MVTCQNCQHQNPPEANFCNNCGAKLKAPETSGESTPAIPKSKAEKLAERRQLTILFCDLVGSTPLSERLDPEEYREVITGYHQVAENAIKKQGGYVAQYLGDGLLVYFGYPEGLEDAPRAGVRAGLGILEALTEANKRWTAAGKTPVKVRIGIHTGLVVVDDHLALGETVNVAARLEGLAPHNGLVISPRTLRLVQGWFDVQSTGKHSLKGISEPMEVFQVLRESGAKTPLDVAKGRGLSPLVGRVEEMAQLLQCWEEAKQGNGALLLLTGEAGIGKSRLVHAIEELVGRGGEGLILEARCSAYQKNSAYHPLIELFEKSLLRFKTDDSPADKRNKLEKFLLRCELDLNTAMPLMAEFLSIPSEAFPPLVMSPVAKRQRTMATLSELLLQQAKERPVLFVLEDLHWADASTLEWLELLQGQVPSSAVFTLCTTRPFDSLQVKAFGRTDQPDVRQLTLQRLNVGEMTKICHYQTKGKVLPEVVLKQIAAKTDGVPLFVEELTKMIVESEMLVEKNESYELTGSVSSLAIPSTLQDSLLARLDRLADVKEVVLVGAVLGREFSFKLLNAVFPKEEADMTRSLAKLLDAEIFYRRRTNGDSVFQFKHALIRDTAYESLLKRRRQQLHQQVANVLEHQFAETAQTQPELLAHHRTEAGQPLQAIPLWKNPRPCEPNRLSFPHC